MIRMLKLSIAPFLVVFSFALMIDFLSVRPLDFYGALLKALPISLVIGYILARTTRVEA